MTLASKLARISMGSLKAVFTASHAVGNQPAEHCRPRNGADGLITPCRSTPWLDRDAGTTGICMFTLWDDPGRRRGPPTAYTSQPFALFPWASGRNGRTEGSASDERLVGHGRMPASPRTTAIGSMSHRKDRHFPPTEDVRPPRRRRPSRRPRSRPLARPTPASDAPCQLPVRL